MSVYYIRDSKYTENQIKQLKHESISLPAISRKPSSLFKYFSNKSEDDKYYSLYALKNNIVHLTHPKGFDDPYDSNAFIDYSSYARSRIEYYLESCDLPHYASETYESLLAKLADRMSNQVVCGKSIEEVFKQDINEHERLVRKNLLLKIKQLIDKGLSDKQCLMNCIHATICEEYNGDKEALDRFKISCFSESPYLMLMWSHYANEHKGFCIEYEVPEFSDESKELLTSIFPVIYTDKRNNLAPAFLKWERSGSPGIDGLCEMYKYGLLSKSMDWKYQKEWRLISLDNIIDVDENDNCEFFKIKKVYLGHNMKPENRKEIIQICKEKNIPYVGVTISDNAFEMKDCDVLCEDCYKMEEKSE